jgi:hypothetical protein
MLPGLSAFNTSRPRPADSGKRETTTPDVATFWRCSRHLGRHLGMSYR